MLGITFDIVMKASVVKAACCKSGTICFCSNISPPVSFVRFASAVLLVCRKAIRSSFIPSQTGRCIPR